MDSLRSAAATVILALALSPAGVAAGDGYRVGAYYFGVWNRPGCNVCSGFNRDWWRGVREYSRGDIAPELPWVGEDFSHLEPALGFYSNSRRAVLERHIRQARANGVDFFAFYWYWGSDLRGGRGREKHADGLRTFLRARNSYDLDFALALAAHPSQRLSLPRGHWERIVSRLVRSYLAQPHYLRTADGRPVVYFIDTRSLGNGSHEEVAEFMALLRQRVREELGVEPFLVVSLELDRLPGVGPGQPVVLKRLEGVDGYSCLNFFPLALEPGSPTTGSQARYNRKLAARLRRWDDRPLIPCYMLGFDERPREMVGLPVWALRRVIDWSPEVMRQGLEKVRSLADLSDDGPVDDWILLYSWNEWREAGRVLEPSRRDGAAIADEVAAAFGSVTFGDETCRRQGDCPGSVAWPEGALEVSSCESLSGWARDPDTTRPLKIEIHRGPRTEGAAPLAAVWANGWRTDLDLRVPRVGFTLATPSALKRGGEERVHVYAVDLGGNGNPAENRVELAGSPGTLRCEGAARTGAQESAGASEAPVPQAAGGFSPPGSIGSPGSPPAGSQSGAEATRRPLEREGSSR